MNKRPGLLVLLALLVVGIGVFVTGIGWGLPSHRIDPYLFGQHPVWSGEEIIAKGGGYPPFDETRSVIVTANPIDPIHPTVVNATDEQRARIVRRYRLQSYHTDEHLTFAALGAMKPTEHEFDPRFYEYGGLWIYPVGALLKLASVTGFVHLRPDLAWYLDRPEEFGRFFVVARLYSAICGLIGIIAVYFLVLRIGGSITAAAVSGLCFLLMPIVINAAHEAKPHLAAAVLMLLTVLAAGRYCESGTRRAWLGTAALAGLALGMVVTSLPILLVLVAMMCLREWPRNKADFSKLMLRAAGGPLIAVFVYFVTNPYVGINLFRNRALLHSDFSHASGFYHATIKGIPNGLFLTGLASSFLLAAIGIIGMIALIIQAWIMVRRSDFDGIRKRSTHVLLTLLGLAVATQFMILAYQHAADYARFGLLFEISLAVQAVMFIEKSHWSRSFQVLCFGLLVLTTGWMGSFYLRAYLRDSSDFSTRILAARHVEKLLDRGDTIVATVGDPVPFYTPPMDLWRTTIIAYPNLQSSVRPKDVDISVRFGSDAGENQLWAYKLFCSTPISFASKHFEIQTLASP